MKTYSEKLKDPRWQGKRLEIIKRDGNKCVFCGETNKLEVHHGYYETGLEPWEYDDETLHTLCNECPGNTQEVMWQIHRHIGQVSPNELHVLLGAILEYKRLSERNHTRLVL